eukprot:CAMPEP_0114553994 /NCGR_PEP_ID=MMETSP0114-20121206/7970_1 /TAXON_ID=31324 /ORGANISM="Goniomonas sp, Strain m" /LENGTH=87 /DNA_ID=CAMNT_0001739005 /DNA_START=246 /DNA_END=507 /DNA_ORIENTATION=-
MRIAQMRAHEARGPTASCGDGPGEVGHDQRQDAGAWDVRGLHLGAALVAAAVGTSRFRSLGAATHDAPLAQKAVKSMLRDELLVILW